MIRALALLTVFLAIPFQASAKRWSNAYVSFDLPEKWNCVLEQTEWVCRPSDPATAPQAIIILTAKEVGPSDSLSAYETHLKTPRIITSRSGQPLTSQVLKVDTRKITNHPWVDGMHKASEIPNYYTRYLATTKDKIAVLVTFSAHQAHYTKYSADFFKAIESLAVIATNSLMAKNGGAGGGGGMFGSATGGAGGDGFGDELPPEGSGEGGGGLGEKTKFILIIALFLGLAGIYLMIKRSKKR